MRPGPDPSRVAARLARVLEPGETVVMAMTARVPARAADADRERVIVTDRRVILVAAGAFDPLTVDMPVLDVFGPEPGQIRSIGLAAITGVAVTRAAHRAVGEGFAWTARDELALRLSDGGTEAIAVDRLHSDRLFDELRRRCGFREVPPAA